MHVVLVCPFGFCYFICIFCVHIRKQKCICNYVRVSNVVLLILNDSEIDVLLFDSPIVAN